MPGAQRTITVSSFPVSVLKVSINRPPGLGWPWRLRSGTYRRGWGTGWICAEGRLCPLKSLLHHHARGCSAPRIGLGALPAARMLDTGVAAIAFAGRRFPGAHLSRLPAWGGAGRLLVQLVTGRGNSSFKHPVAYLGQRLRAMGRSCPRIRGPWIPQRKQDLLLLVREARLDCGSPYFKTYVSQSGVT